MRLLFCWVCWHWLTSRLCSMFETDKSSFTIATLVVLAAPSFNYLLQIRKDVNFCCLQPSSLELGCSIFHVINAMFLLLKLQGFCCSQWLEILRSPCSLHIQQPAAANLYRKCYTLLLNAAAFWLQPAVMNFDVFPKLYELVAQMISKTE